MFVQLIVAAFVSALILGHPIIPCPDGSDPPIRLMIEGCDSSPCHVNQGGNVTYEMDFFAHSASETMTFAIFSTVFGEENPVVLPPELKNACNTIVQQCPVYANQLLTQRATIPVTTELYAGIPAQLRVTMAHDHDHDHDHDDDYCACALVNIVIH